MKNRAGSEPSGGADLAAANTVAPAAASRRTIAAPSPRLPPVTSARRPASPSSRIGEDPSIPLPPVGRQAVEEFDALVRGEHGASLVRAQVNEHALWGLAAARTLQQRLGDLTRALATGEGPEGMLRGRLALSAVIMAAARGRELGGRQAERHAAALAVARSLIAPETGSWKESPRRRPADHDPSRSGVQSGEETAAGGVDVFFSAPGQGLAVA
ncbi:hypothetical protein OG751_08330 [Streptomyces antimycoticus]|uniref:Uncharacterized protein n=1 Tax=Streptomyces mordarskii TaxID=1226758 RepID=A0ABN1CMB0_9ACTN|nr:hypothetical protein [Streptomyces sp. WAC05858]WTA87437.1 hypothetical protein OG751_08330 [Streptomyces antimycoticus]